MNNDSPWQYKPDGKQTAAAPDLPAQNSAPAASRPKATDSVTWTASEYIEHSRGAGWYLLLIVGTGAVAGLIYLITKDYFATGVIVALGLIVAIFSTHKPRQIEYELSATGLRRGDRSYPLSLFKTYAIIREGPLSSVNLVPVKRFMPPLTIYFEPSQEAKIIGILGEHLPMQEGGLDPVERLSRRLRL